MTNTQDTTRSTPPQCVQEREPFAGNRIALRCRHPAAGQWGGRVVAILPEPHAGLLECPHPAWCPLRKESRRCSAETCRAKVKHKYQQINP